jgi:type IV pilus assembly protein PilV
MNENWMRRQAGMTLIEVLVALLVFSVGVLGAAMLQLNALKYTDSALRSSQASFIAHDMLERIRANPVADYSLSSLGQAPSAANHGQPRDHDVYEFATQVRRMGGPDAEASISFSGSRATITLSWNDQRAEQKTGLMQTFTLTSTFLPTRATIQ